MHVCTYVCMFPAQKLNVKHFVNVFKNTNTKLNSQMKDGINA